MITSAQAITISYYSSLLWCIGCKYNYKVSQIIQNLKGVEGVKCLLVILEEWLLTILQYDVVGLSCIYQLVFYFCFSSAPTGTCLSGNVYNTGQHSIIERGHKT